MLLEAAGNGNTEHALDMRFSGIRSKMDWIESTVPPASLDNKVVPFYPKESNTAMLLRDRADRLLWRSTATSSNKDTNVSTVAGHETGPRA
ncbi:hypothetical protein LTR56_020246 [Elasticomyces elasticus]|nr:hypothetical protein LTR56_020246 [Elasticomyces elasticus]KAK4907439.1 hypothetical protein LTR49_023542 [Elasticomyces elasticus]KAK5747847.1 hypothetical protein LTS12_022104 [Elasticomyces elasticus]